MFKKFFGPAYSSIFIQNNKIYLGSTVPGKNIIKSFGLVSMTTKGIHINIDKELEGLIPQFLAKIDEIGANAVINFRFETGSYTQGPSWIFSYIIMYGEGVLAQ